MNVEDFRYNRWLGHNEIVPARCRTWIVNPSGYCYPVRCRAEGRRLVQEWNRHVHSERDVYTLRCV